MISSITAFWEQVDILKKFDPGYHYTCINEGADVVANGIVATVQDLVVASLPTLLCWKLQLPVRQKVALYAIFAISYSTVALGALRTWTTYRIYFQTYDVTWHANDTFFFSLLELHVGAMCANAPSLKVFFKHVLSSEKLSKLIGSRSSHAPVAQEPSVPTIHHKQECPRRPPGYLSDFGEVIVRMGRVDIFLKQTRMSQQTSTAGL
jgi:hypothetical protein